MPLFRRFRMSLYGRLSCLRASLTLRPCFPYARVYLRPGASLSRFNCRASEQIRGRASSWWYYTHAELNERRWRSRRRCWVTSGRADSRVCMYVYIWEPLPQAAAQPTLTDAQIYVFFLQRRREDASMGWDGWWVYIIQQHAMLAWCTGNTGLSFLAIRNAWHTDLMKLKKVYTENNFFVNFFYRKIYYIWYLWLGHTRHTRFFTF